MRRAKRQREELGWNPTLAEFKRTTKNASEVKALTAS